MLRILIALMSLLCTLPASGTMVERAVASQLAEVETPTFAEEELHLVTIPHVAPVVRVALISYVHSPTRGIEPTSDVLRPPRA